MDIAEDQEIETGEPVVIWKPVEPPGSRCCHWVRNADRRFTKNWSRLLTKCGIIPSEWAALRQLYGPQWWSPVELGRVLGMSKGGASKLVSRLVKKGLVDKLTNDSDRRFRSVGLTQQGREFVVRMVPFEKGADREFYRPIGNTRRFRLTVWMKRMLAAGHLEHLHQWMSEQLGQPGVVRVDPGARARAEAEAQAKADAFWAYCKSVGEAAAYGRPPPPEPSWLLRPER